MVRLCCIMLRVNYISSLILYYAAWELYFIAYTLLCCIMLRVNYISSLILYYAAVRKTLSDTSSVFCLIISKEGGCEPPILHFHNYGDMGADCPTLSNLHTLHSRYCHNGPYRSNLTFKTIPDHPRPSKPIFSDGASLLGRTLFPKKKPEGNLNIKQKMRYRNHPTVTRAETLNELAGGHSGCVAWPGCPYSYKDRNVTYWEPYNHSMTLHKKMDHAVWWMNNAEKPANLVFIYHDEPDWVGHVYGPNSPFVHEELLKIDSALKYLHDKLQSYGLLELVDIVVLSDHGMSPVPESQIIFLSNFDNLEKHKFFYMGASPVLNIWPLEGTEILDLYSTLEDGCRINNCTVMLNSENTKHNIPSEWHYARNSRVSRITLLADEGYVFEDFDTLVQDYKRKYPNVTNIHGDHGYPVEDPTMEPIFVASGPSFKRGYESPVFSSVDVYPLLCEILSLNAPPNNGSFAKVEHILVKPIIGSLLKPLIIALSKLLCTLFD
ncbi:unnamed protein product, partial [Meganyctiphanes norvegica]